MLVEMNEILDAYDSMHLEFAYCRMHLEFEEISWYSIKISKLGQNKPS
jgi:hypothetical protein